ncbi:DUF721 domain-containing protein [bacterium]|nr:DUF721 domain-containing protein [bacterium]
MKKRGFSSAREIIEVIKKKIGLKEEKYKIHQIWMDVSGEIAQHTQVIKVKNGKIWVTVESPVYCQEIFLRKKELVEKINKAIGEEKIKDIKLTIKNM